MQNEPNFGKAQMNVNLYNTTDYEEKCNWTLGENKPNQSQLVKTGTRPKTQDTRPKIQILSLEGRPEGWRNNHGRVEKETIQGDIETCVLPVGDYRGRIPGIL